MMDYSKILSQSAVSLKPSGIRKFFDLIETRPECIALTVGQPDFVTPWRIREAAIESLEEGKTYYTSNAGTLPLREEISKYLVRRFGMPEYDPKSEIVVTVGGSEGIDNGIIYSCEKCGVPYVLAGSIRDDGPVPEIFGNVYEAQDAMRNEIRSATTVICMATMLHTIAVGNMTPSYRVMPDGTVRQIYFYCVDISEFAVNKLADRGSLSARGIVTNAQDFIVNLAKGLNVY